FHVTGVQTCALPISTIVNPEELASNAQANQIDGATMSVAIMTNNIKVAILAFAGGITCGLLTVYVMIYNGLLVGALAGVFWHAQIGRASCRERAEVS